MIKILTSVVCFLFTVAASGQVNTRLKRSIDNINSLHPAVSAPVLQDTVADKALSKLSGNSSGFFPAVDLRAVDGLFLGAGYRFVTADSVNGTSGMQKISLMKNLNSEATQLKYSGEWKGVFGSTDIVADGFADFKGNILNFFGRGNETGFDRSGDFRTFYRVKFSLFQLTPALRFNLSEQVKLTVGPSVQYSTFDPNDNTDRLINNTAIVSQYEHFYENKAHGGIVLNLAWDTRDNKMLPTRGLNLTVLAQAYTGLNDYSNQFTQVFPQISVYRALDAKGNIVVAERLGAGFTTGKTAFYQSAFLGSQDNLLGYRKFRFAGDNLLYNNLEARFTLLNIEGKRSVKAGLIGFYDVGRVWIKNETSTSIHQGYGGGIFLSPLNRLLARVVAGFSTEGIQLTAAVRQRF